MSAIIVTSGSFPVGKNHDIAALNVEWTNYNILLLALNYRTSTANLK